jgi:hypothetical protein
VTTPGVANASSVVYYQLGQLANNRSALARSSTCLRVCAHCWRT